MRESYQTDRLKLDLLSPPDAGFILRLLNSAGWLKFIGDRNIHSTQDALNYIEKTVANPKITYWVVRSVGENLSMGMVSFIKRDYLENHDIGFAFLPEFSGNGYALEAAKVVLTDLLKAPDHQTILATTLKENRNSIRLLEKLGFRFKKEIEPGGEKLQLYSISAG
jgi:[ribosomal protein S5]-alanine N-acetyltransferase